MRRLSQWRKIVICAVLCLALAAASAACGQRFSGTGASAEAASGTSVYEEAEAAFAPSADTPSVTPGKKEETVYVKADAYGMPTEKNVEVILRDIRGQDLIEDRSNLKDIRNTEGDEEYCAVGEDRYLWENHGGEIRYKGKSAEALPVDVRVTYYLEGQEVKAEEIAGKTGAVRIRFDYENHTDVPFMVLSSVILSSDVFRDVEVTNGRIIDLGEQKAVVGCAFPGLMDSLKLADYEPTEEIDLPEYVEIEARAEKFELGFTATVVSTGLFEEIGEDDLGDLEKIADDMGDLTDASSELADAAEDLADGGGEFGSYLSRYFDGLKQISEGTDALDQGLTALSDNIKKLSDGSQTMQNSLEQLDKSLSGIDLSALSSGKEKEAAKEAGEALQSIGEGSAELKQILGTLSDNVAVMQEFNTKAKEYSEKAGALAAAVKDFSPASMEERAEDYAALIRKNTADQVEEKAGEFCREKAGEAAEKTAEKAAGAAVDAVNDSTALDDLGLTPEQINAAKNAFIGEIQESIANNTGDVDVSSDFSLSENGIDPAEGISDLLAEADESNKDEYAAVLAAAEELPELEVPEGEILSGEQLAKIEETMGSMEKSLGVISGYADRISSYSESLTEVAASMKKLKSGVSALAEGSGELNKGISAFSEGLKKTAEGSSQLNEALGQASKAGNALGRTFWKLVEGMNAFADGVSEFDEEGIQSLAELAGPSYLEVIRRVRAARDAERGYTNFSGICDGQKGSVRFIIETAEISADM